MDLNARFRNVSVIGAAGKMGSGIALLLAREMAFRAIEDQAGSYVLNLIDVKEVALEGLLGYLQEHGEREAEKQLPRLRQLFRGLGDDEVVQAFVHELLRHVRTGTALSLARESLLVFEACFENEALKTGIYRDLAHLCPRETYFCSNTSSIPLHVLSEASGIQGRLVGFHFYNPAAVQQLIELITPQDCSSELKELSLELAKFLGKTVVPANDIAGFIGNGYLMRDGLHAIAEVERLAPEFGFHQALYLVDRVSRDWLLRPLGIFQLMDFVGLDVFQLILNVMNQHLSEDLHCDLIDRFVRKGSKGGVTLSGAQKDGFFRYEKTHPVAVCNPEADDYTPLDQPWAWAITERLGEHPDPTLSWKNLNRDPQRQAKLAAYFQGFKQGSTLAVDLAIRHLQADRRTALKLVEQGVAACAEDVNRVLQLGFLHLYGPINDYLSEG